MDLSGKIKSLPDKPGVYQFLDKEGIIIYVGKAKSLKKRVASYFNKGRHESGKTILLVKNIHDVNPIIVDSEYEALLLENSLVKRHQPRYNIQLKDDKTFPWICIKKERFPRVISTRTLKQDGSEYFGPYASVKMMKTVLDLVFQLYPIRNCNYNLSEDNIKKEKFKVCLEYHIGNCLGPCANHQNEEDYNQSIQEIRNIIKGNLSNVIKQLKELMDKHSADLEFESAQLIKDKIETLEKYKSRSTVVNPKINNIDVFTIISEENFAYVNYMRINNGAIIQAHTLELKKKLGEDDKQLLEFGIADLRLRFDSDVKEMLIPFEIDVEIPDVKCIVPIKGDKKTLLDLSTRNAKFYMLDKQKERNSYIPKKRETRILEEMKELLRLSELPEHIECFDCSNLQGSFPVAACVVFKDVKPAKKDYRIFNIKTVEGPNDFASMEEVIERRYGRLLKEGQNLPQLILVDGGKGQLSSAVKSLEKLNLRGKIAIIGIAKKLEEIYYPDDSIPLYLDKKSETLRIIQFLRNEAHRFGIKHHRNRRSKVAFTSGLTDIEGIGPTTAQNLLKTFKSVKRIKEANLEEIEAVVGKKKAEVVRKALLA
ncbi:MAG: excinuclease ABC subunit UvrC [Flavobacteriales bacterium]|nr:excinuclease ABC subunit UvrC [Flavobacteriales bacterium]